MTPKVVANRLRELNEYIKDWPCLDMCDVSFHPGTLLPCPSNVKGSLNFTMWIERLAVNLETEQ